MPSRSPEYLRTGSRRRSQTVGSAATSRRRHMPASDTDRESRPPSAAARDIPVDIARLDALARSAVVRLPCCITRRARAWARSSLALTLSVLESKGSEGRWWEADGGLKSCANHPQQSATHRRHDARTVHNARTPPPLRGSNTAGPVDNDKTKAGEMKDNETARRSLSRVAERFAEISEAATVVERMHASGHGPGQGGSIGASDAYCPQDWRQ